MRILLTLSIAAVVLLPCCKPPTPKVTANVDSLATVYAELLVLNERYSMSTDSLSSGDYEHEYQRVLEQHAYTRERFSKELETVARSPEAFRQLCDRAFAKFPELRKRPVPSRPRG